MRLLFLYHRRVLLLHDMFPSRPATDQSFRASSTRPVSFWLDAVFKSTLVFFIPCQNEYLTVCYCLFQTFGCSTFRTMPLVSGGFSLQLASLRQLSTLYVYKVTLCVFPLSEKVSLFLKCVLFSGILLMFSSAEACPQIWNGWQGSLGCKSLFDVIFSVFFILFCFILFILFIYFFYFSIFLFFFYFFLFYSFFLFVPHFIRSLIIKLFF